MDIAKTRDNTTKHGYRNIIVEVRITDDDIRELVGGNHEYHLHSFSADYDLSKITVFLTLTEGVS